MNALTAFKALGPIDYKSVRRDSMLAWLIAIPFMAALGMRTIIPQINTWLVAEFSFSLEPYYILLMGSFFFVSAMMAGVIVGFLMLDERDDRTLLALQVTPLPLNTYLLYRLSLPVLIGFIVTMLAWPLLNWFPLSFGALVVITLLAALEAPIFALALAIFAENKVAGFALMKASGVVQLAPIIAWFVDTPWQYFFGLVPLYWPAKLFWVAVNGEPGFWIYALVGLAVHLIYLAIALKRFSRIMSRE